MKLAFGLVAILVGLFFLGGLFRGLTPHNNRRAHNLGDLINGTLLVIMFGGTGVSLLADSRLWWVFLPSCTVATALWSKFYLRKMKRKLLENVNKNQ